MHKRNLAGIPLHEFLQVDSESREVGGVKADRSPIRLARFHQSVNLIRGLYVALHVRMERDFHPQFRPVRSELLRLFNTGLEVPLEDAEPTQICAERLRNY